MRAWTSWCARSSAVDIPTRLPPTINTGVSISDMDMDVEVRLFRIERHHGGSRSQMALIAILVVFITRIFHQVVARLQALDYTMIAPRLGVHLGIVHRDFVCDVIRVRQLITLGDM